MSKPFKLFFLVLLGVASASAANQCRASQILFTEVHHSIVTMAVDGVPVGGGFFPSIPGSMFPSGTNGAYKTITGLEFCPSHVVVTWQRTGSPTFVNLYAHHEAPHDTCVISLSLEDLAPSPDRTIPIAKVGDVVSVDGIEIGFIDLTDGKPAPPGLQQQIPAAEYAALVDLYTSTQGQNWWNAAGWNDPTAPYWYGVTVTGFKSDPGTGQILSMGSVTELYLPGGLSGNLPESLGNLVNLRDLILQGNQLSGSIPESFGNLVNLQGLLLQGNQLSGSIPESLGNLVNLQNLDLSGNQLSGSIPESLGNLVNLQRLDLSGNQLSGNIPASLGNLVNLQSLSLYNNQLSGNIPASLGNLVNLQSLSLYNNQLSGNVPASLGNLANLQSLNLSGNQLSGNITDFSVLPNLFWLDIRGNCFDISVGSEVRTVIDRQFQAGRYAYVLQNPDCAPTATYDLKNDWNGDDPNQPWTYLVKNRFNDDVETGGFGYLRGADVFLDPPGPPRIWGILGFAVGWSQSNGSEAVPDSTGSMRDLQPGDIYAYSWDQGPVAVSWTSPVPGYIHVTGGIWPLRDIGRTNAFTLSLNGVAQASGLVGSGDPFDRAHPNTFGFSANVQAGDVVLFSVNPAGTLADYFGLNLTVNEIGPGLQRQIPAAEYAALLDLYNGTQGQNWLGHHKGWTDPTALFWGGVTVSAVQYEPITDQVIRVGTVTALDLSTSEPHGTLPGSLGNLVNLQRMAFGPGYLSGPIPESLGNLVHLQTLHIFNNQLSGPIPESLGNLVNLQTLVLGLNDLSGSIPESLGNLANLQSLDLSVNQLSGRIPDRLGNLVNLESLHLESNELAGPIPDTLGNLLKLGAVWMGGNAFGGTIPESLGNLVNLGILNLCCNNPPLVGNLPESFTNLVNMGFLIITHNCFDISPGSQVRSIIDKLPKDSVQYAPQNGDCAPGMPGDLNDDGCVDQSDLSLLTSQIRARSSDLTYDLNGRGSGS